MFLGWCLCGVAIPPAFWPSPLLLGGGYKIFILKILNDNCLFVRFFFIFCFCFWFWFSYFVYFYMWVQHYKWPLIFYPQNSMSDRHVFILSNVLSRTMSTINTLWCVNIATGSTLIHFDKLLTLMNMNWVSFEIVFKCSQHSGNTNQNHTM